MCCGRTPWATFVDGKKLWGEKNLSAQFNEKTEEESSRAAGGPIKRPLEPGINFNQKFKKEVLTEKISQ